MENVCLMNKSFVIEYPLRLDNKNSAFKLNFGYQKKFYDNLFEVLEEEGILYRKIDLLRHIDKFKSFGKDEIYLAYHRNRINKPNMYTIKEGYTLHEMYFDKMGYSGWAEIANDKNLFDDSQKVDLDDAKEFMNAYIKRYKKESLTKYVQPNKILNIPDKFVFVALQVSTDTVSELADIQSYDLAKAVSEVYSNTSYKVVVKPHPRDLEFRDRKINGAMITKGSISYLIPSASAVYTVNSGVGFEALLYGKPVFTSGHSDYHWATTRVRNFDDIKSTVGMFNVNNEKVVKFLYYYLNDYVISYDDKNRIKEKIYDTIANAL